MLDAAYAAVEAAILQDGAETLILGCSAAYWMQPFLRDRLAAARNFHTASAPYQAQFEDYDLPPTFRADGMTIITAIEAAQAAADTGTEQTGGATGGIAAAIKEMSRLMNKLNAIVKNKYAENPQKLAAWTIASHLEAAPKNKGGAVQ